MNIRLLSIFTVLAILLGLVVVINGADVVVTLSAEQQQQRQRQGVVNGDLNPPPVTTTGCKSDEDCSLLGKCDSATGACKCKTGWTGTTCSKMDLLPWRPGQGYINASRASWGGRPLYYNGEWHLIATEIAQQCPLILFMNNSQIVRATASSPAGPYTRQQTVLPPFRHNPTFVGPTPDGYYLIFFIGATNDERLHIDCTRGNPPCAYVQGDFCRGGKGHKPASNGEISVAWARNPAGPWQSRVILPRFNGVNATAWDCENNNPSVAIRKDGSIYMIFRANSCVTSGEYLGVAEASHWNASYTRRPSPIVTPDSGTGNHEDPFVWIDEETGFYHIVSHCQSTDNVCGQPFQDTGHSCGAHLFSRDGVQYSVSPEPTYTGSIPLVNGTMGKLLTRQRPQIIFGPDGSPTHLFNGASFQGNNPDADMLTHTLAFTFRSGQQEM